MPVHLISNQESYLCLPLFSVTLIMRCLLGFGDSQKVLKKKLQVSQNKIVRFILDLGPRSHVGQCELDRAGMLNTKDRAKQLILIYMYNIYYQTAPGYLCENFERISHRYGTRYMQNNFFHNKPQGIKM